MENELVGPVLEGKAVSKGVFEMFETLAVDIVKAVGEGRIKY
jgi:hypothetical protein